MSVRDDCSIVDLTDRTLTRLGQEQANGKPSELVDRYASRIGVLATEIVRAHDLGIGEGDHSEPWTLGFQRSAVEVYLETLPHDYLRGVAMAYEGCARKMSTVACSGSAAEDWGIVRSYLSSVSEAIWEHPDIEPPRVWETVQTLMATPPALLRYDDLAALVRSDGVVRLRSASETVRGTCQRLLYRTPSSDEIKVLRLIVAGKRKIDIAVEVGCSERTLYRQLRDLCVEMGVLHISELVLRGGQEGWI